MPSSTSNSDHIERYPILPRRSLSVAALGALLACAGLGGAIEWGWRRRGFVPSVRDSAELWDSQRRIALKQGPRALAIVGSSRFQLGLDPQSLAGELPRLTPIQLAIDGCPAPPVLASLAATPEFCGTVLCEVLPQNFFIKEMLDPSLVPWLAYAHDRPAVAGLEQALRRFWQRRLVATQPSLAPQVLLRRAALGTGLPTPAFFSMRADRFIEADYATADVPRLTAKWLAKAKEARVPGPDELRSVLSTLAEQCRAIRARGGRVIFVRMISSFELRKLEDAKFPKAMYWDRLLQVTQMPGIYDTELQLPDSLVCPEGSHLGAAQARVFSRALAAALRARGLLA